MPFRPAAFETPYQNVYCRGWFTFILVQRHLSIGNEEGRTPSEWGRFTKFVAAYGNSLRLTWRFGLMSLVLSTAIADHVANIRGSDPYWEYYWYLTNLTLLLQVVWTAWIFVLQVNTWMTRRKLLPMCERFYTELVLPDAVEPRLCCTRSSCDSSQSWPPAMFSSLWVVNAVVIPASIFLTVLWYAGEELVGHNPATSDLRLIIKHGLSASLIWLDMATTNMPFYFFHCLWAFLYVALYQLWLLLVIYGFNHGQPVYSFIDYEGEPLLTACSYAAGFGFVAVAGGLMVATQLYQTKRLEGGVWRRAFQPKE
ncbi:MAG: uncharacterized protein KVP18_001850 [Porospora cf. gigantea A]|uniref:uncharacterized protein n=1 Tax=Porospora cf. gigantea A TaxID=2853593 RepID=UPI00355A019A|nr:MAG: hypothetical protein KVP18_001850 [Porospora cf. gigantea A]